MSKQSPKKHALEKPVSFELVFNTSVTPSLFHTQVAVVSTPPADLQAALGGAGATLLCMGQTGSAGSDGSSRSVRVQCDITSTQRACTE